MIALQNGFMVRGLSLLLWMSPFFRFGIFFPLGVWFLYPRSASLRAQSFTILAVQVFVFAVFYTLEISYFLNLDLEAQFQAFHQANPDGLLGVLWVSGLVWLVANAVYLRYCFSKSPRVSPNRKRNRMAKILWILLAWVLSVVFSVVNSLQDTGMVGNPIDFMSPIGREKAVALDFYLSLALFHSWFSKGQTFALLKPLFTRMTRSALRRRKFLTLLHDGRRPDGDLLRRIHAGAFRRDNYLPGWGHIYAGDFWKGFPLLFLFLLSLFLFAVAYFAWDSPLLGIQFLSSWGLKPGIPDKEFFLKAVNVSYMVSLALLTGIVYVFSKYLLYRTFLGLRLHANPERNTMRGGFWNHLPVSLLAHLVFITLILIIPFTIQRQKASDKKQERADHFQPDHLEFYFIDPNIPDSVENLNGGVITGTETPNKEEGEKISDEKAADMGPKKGYIKRIKGKKVPATYSNYISAKMRGPENYLDYWRRAPKPYSSVVAYTITAEGFVEDVELVEGSSYPEQDRLTLELIESLSPLMAPPSNGKDIRVTELFWNGSLDPDAMPTALQKEMVTHFDGRYMEEMD